jgi:hypothetical protein
MSNTNDAEAIGGLIMIALVLFLVYLIVIAMLWIAGMTIAAGTAFGGGVSLYNYGVAFKNNVKLEKPRI